MPELEAWEKLIWGTAITTAGWLSSAWILPSEDPEVLRAFVKKTGVSGPGWQPYLEPEALLNGGGSIGTGLLQAFLGSVAVYAALLATGSWLYGETGMGCCLTLGSLIAGGGVYRIHARTQLSAT